MTKSNLFRQAHKLTREDAKVYLNINYRVQFGLNLKALYSNENMVKIKYTLNDNAAYGIYNGFSEWDMEIKNIVAKYRNQYNTSIITTASEDIVEILNKNKEIEKIAIENYVATEIPENYREEIKKLYKEMAIEKTAPGYGLIDMSLLEKEIEKIIKSIKEKEIEKNKEKENRINELIKKAKNTREKQIVNRYLTECNDKNMDCSTDAITIYIDENGNKTEKRVHTF